MASRTPHPKPQHPPGPALVPLPEGEAAGRQRTRLLIDRRSTALLDADNFAGGCKALIDCLRQSGLIPDDDPETLEVTFRQTRVRRRQDEGTHLAIQGPDHRPPAQDQPPA